MNVLIKETGELRPLSFIDWRDRSDYTEFLLRSSGALRDFCYDEDALNYMTDAATFEKWSAFFDSHKTIDVACAALNILENQHLSYDPLVHP